MATAPVPTAPTTSGSGSGSGGGAGAGASSGGGTDDSDRVLWRDVAWSSILDGVGVAPFYFMRSGLIRKDLLPLYTGDHAPETFKVGGPEAAAKVIAAADGDTDGTESVWVVKRAASSNAEGLAFLHVALPPPDEEDVEWLFRLADVLHGPSTPVAPATSTGDGDSGGDSGSGGGGAAAGSGSGSGAGAGAGAGSDPSAAPTRRRRTAKPSWVLQRCIRPATVAGGYKFHIRLVVLAVGALRVFTHANSRVIRATEPFRWGDWQNQFVHATNRTVNKFHANYDIAAQDVSLWALPPDVARHLWASMRLIVTHVFRAAARNPRRFLVLPNCYELFGLDFMVASTGQVMLLEVNPDPGKSMFSVCAGNGDDARPTVGSVTVGSLPVPPPTPSTVGVADEALPPLGCLTVPTVPSGFDPQLPDADGTLPAGFRPLFADRMLSEGGGE